MKQLIRSTVAAVLFSGVSAFALAPVASAQHVAGGVQTSHTEIDTAIVAAGWSVVHLLRQVVRNDEDKLVGYVHDAILAPDGKASFVIVNVAGFLNIGHKLVALPSDAFSVSDDGKVKLANATKENLKALPKFVYNRK